MGDYEHKSSSSSRDKDKDRKHRHRGDDERDRHSKRHRSSHGSSRDKDRSSKSSHSSHRSSRKDKATEDDEDEWVEKDAPQPSFSSSLLGGAGAASLPPPPVDTVGTFTPGQSSAHGGLERLSGAAMTDGFGEGDVEEQGGGMGDLFSAMGTERKRREPKEKVDPSVGSISSGARLRS